MTCEAQSQQKDGTLADCKRDGVKGLEIDGKTLCKHHYAFGMLEKRLEEIGISKTSESSPKKDKFECTGTTKKGPCQNKIFEEGGLCKMHAKVKAKKDSGEETKKEPKPTCRGFTAKGDACKISAAEGCDGLCKKHFGKTSEKPVKDKTETSDLSIDQLLEEAKKKSARTPKLPSRKEIEETSDVANDNPMANIDIPFEIPA